MNITSSPQREHLESPARPTRPRGRSVAVAAALGVVAVATTTAVLLVGGHDGGASADQGAPARPAAPAAAADDRPEAPAIVTADDLLPADDEARESFPGPAVSFPDGSTADSDGTTLTVTTADGIEASVALPTEAEGWISGVPVVLGEAGTGYLVTQSAGEFIQQSLAVLSDGGDLTIAAAPADRPFGTAYDEGTHFESWTTDGGHHLYTRYSASGDGSDVYDVVSWDLSPGGLVPTELGRFCLDTDADGETIC